MGEIEQMRGTGLMGKTLQLAAMMVAALLLLPQRVLRNLLFRPARAIAVSCLVCAMLLGFNVLPAFASISISPTTLPNPSCGVPYSQTLTATGGSGSDTLSAYRAAACHPVYPYPPAVYFPVPQR